MNKKKNIDKLSKTNKSKKNTNNKSKKEDIALSDVYINYIKFYKDNFLNISDEYINLKKYINEKDMKPNSYDRRLIYIYSSYYFNFDTVNTITSIFKIKSLLPSTKDKSIDVIFGFGFYDTRKNEKFHTIMTRSYNTDKNIIPKFIIINGGYDSKDGEYRNGLLSFHSLDMIQSPLFEKYHLNELLLDIKNYLKDKLKDRFLGLYEDFFYPNEDIQMSVNYKDSYENIDRLYIYFSFAWFKFFNDRKLDIIPNHLGKKYIELFTGNKDHLKEDEEFFNSICNKYESKSIMSIRYALNNFINYYFMNENAIDIVLQLNIKFGQKLIPLSLSEVSNPFSIVKKPWREYLISLKLSDYVLNNISPGFAITNNWFYIKNSRKGLFDNEIQYDKLERSEIVEQISTLLKRAQKYASDNEYNKYTSSNKKIIKSFVINKFKKLAEKINDPIVYANDEILMSNVALNIISEYVGRTFYDMIILSQKSVYYNNLLGNPFGNFDNEYFKKYIFDICYNILCLNQRAGIIHGDLHLNNVTGKPSNYNNSKVDNLQKLYIIDDDNYYLTPDNNYDICIIDFSRSIISPDKINLYVDDSLPNSFEINNNIEHIQRDQITRLISIYINYSNTATNIDELNFIFSTKFEAVFKLLTVVDIYGFTKKLLTLFKMNNINVSKKCIDFVNIINSDCKVFLYEYMNKLILDNDFSTKVINMEYPLKTIIKKNFSSFHMPKTGNIKNISDIFNINNDLKYSINKLDKFSPFMLYNRNKEDIDLCVKNRKEYEKQKRNNMKIINFIANRQIQKN